MEWSRYRFRSIWSLEAAPEAVYEVLERPDLYPEWWPQIREVRQIDDTSGVLRFRSVLPFDLTVLARSARQDPHAGVLEAAMTGDLEGWVRWTILNQGPAARATPATPVAPAALAARSRLVFEQEVVVRKPLMRALAVPGRPFFLANHAVMMRRGRAGLQSLLTRRAAPPGLDSAPPDGQLV